MNDEFENFMERVAEIEKLVKDMRCSEPSVAERARRKADLLLGAVGAEGKDLEDPLLKDGITPDDQKARCKKDRTVINQKAFDRIGGGDDPAEMSKELFMAQVEKDAEMRAKDRRQRKQNAAELREKANEAFKSKKFEVALDFYNKAIDETRDSAVLYENRALTFLNLGLYFRVVNDCDLALRLNENSLKALLYKAKALYYLEEKKESAMCIDNAKKKYPQHHKFITEYKEMWADPMSKLEDAEE